MTKQEEIREGIAKKIYEEHYAIDKDDTFEITYKRYQNECRDLADEILIYLHSQGVVIKVAEISEDLAQTASESPKYFTRGEHMALVSTERTFHIFKDFKDMGYVAVEPLIKKGGD